LLIVDFLIVDWRSGSPRLNHQRAPFGYAQDKLRYTKGTW